jgi:hypothetical protein
MKENLNRTVFDKDKFNSTVDKNFKELSSTLDPRFFDINLATEEDFFELYRKLFYEIPKLGIVDSHEFLVKESGEYLGDLLTNDTIQALLEEITELRQENLDLRQGILDSAGIEGAKERKGGPQQLIEKLKKNS